MTNGQTLCAQTIVYHNDPAAIMRALASIDRAAELAIAAGALTSVSVAYGDSSKDPVFNEIAAENLARACPHLSSVTYQFFNANMGTAGGHNLLAKTASSDLLLLLNPDVVFAPNALIELLKPLAKPDVGIVEGRQLPIEHPKDYHPVTGETGWATGACSLISTALFKQLGGYDAASFFLYCDDVDLSWRVRLAGYKVIFQPSANFYHDKRLSGSGGWAPSEAEKYYSAESYLLMAHKYSRPAIVAKTLKSLKASKVDHLMRAAAEYERRRATGALPQPLDADHRVSEFTDGNYTTHRFAL